MIGPALTKAIAHSSTPFRDRARYQIIGEHGRGGLGRVFRAHDVELGRDVAIKELISRASTSELRFVREALITARLEHPGIVPVHEAGRWPDGTPFYAMKLVSGRPLRSLIAERTTVEQRTGLLHHVIAVADAIAYAHGRNIIHRDLKPANVIVGDFGETVVIDWGLAKDLSSTDDSDLSGSPFRTNPEDDLTAAGTILGTPAYMAPEQERGDRVDQRVDVFAIGAMLWELCSMQKVPPIDRNLRHRLLRKAAIDRDLITIIDKALEPDPRRRYFDAGALAADLKAFKSGARIGARNYSLLAILGHLTRRHRTAALAMTIAVAVATTSIGLYVHNIAAERDRADLSENVATDSLNDMTLKHAELLLTSDPSAAFDLIASYVGRDVERAHQIRAEALGRGIATLKTVPHTDTIRWVRGVAGGVVVSMSMDGTISRTLPNGRAEVLASGVKSGATFSYAATRELLAYVCDPDDLCILNIATGKAMQIRPGHSYSPIALSFSANGEQLALLSSTGDLRVLNTTLPEQPVERFYFHAKTGGGVLFVDPDAIAIGDSDGLRIVHTSGDIRALADPDGSLWDIGPSEHQIVLATTTGRAYIADVSSLRIGSSAQLCRDSVSGLKSIQKKGVVAFACKEGTIGIWDPRTMAITTKAHIDGHANILEVSASADYIVAAGNKGTLAVVDLRTDLVTSLVGQGFRITAISPPTKEYPFFLSGDVRGGIRAWPVPNPIVKVLADTHQKVYSTFYDSELHALVAGTRGSALITYSNTAGLAEAGPHSYDTQYIAPSSDHSMFASYGNSALIEIWSASPLVRRSVIRAHQGTVTHAEFMNNAGNLVTSGKDSALAFWSPTGKRTDVRDFDQPIETFTLTHGNESVVLATQDGAVWLTRKDHSVVGVRTGGARVTKLISLPDGVSVSIGYSDGNSIILDTQTLQQVHLIHAADSVRDMAASSDGSLIAVASNDNVTHIGFRSGSSWTGATWTSLSAPVRRATLTRDGLLITICTDGSIWAYSNLSKNWLYLITNLTELTQVIINYDETFAFIFDIDGHLASINIDAVRQSLQAHNRGMKG